MTWSKVYDGLWVASAGLLHAGIQFNGEDSYNWWVGTTPALDDKSDEHAIVQGNERLLEEAKKEARRAMVAQVTEMVKGLGMYR